MIGLGGLMRNVGNEMFGISMGFRVAQVHIYISVFFFLLNFYSPLQQG